MKYLKIHFGDNMPVRRGEQHPAAKLTDKKVMEIKGLWKIGHRNIRVIAKNYGVSQSNIKKIVNEETWTHLKLMTEIPHLKERVVLRNIDKMKKLTYLATPYSHPDSEIREQRFRIVNRVAGKLMDAGHLIYSPISHTYPIAIEYNLPVNWEFWEFQCMSYLKLSEKLIVLMQDGWKESVGVTGEIRIAEQLGIPIEYIDV